jgi:hypothetical protein
MQPSDGTCRPPSDLPSPGRCFRRSRLTSPGPGVPPRQPGMRLVPCPRVRTVCLVPHRHSSLRFLASPDEHGRPRNQEVVIALTPHSCVDRASMCVDRGEARQGRQGVARAGARFNFATPPNRDQLPHAVTRSRDRCRRVAHRPASTITVTIAGSRPKGHGRTLIRPPATRPGGRGPRPRRGARPNPAARDPGASRGAGDPDRRQERTGEALRGATGPRVILLHVSQPSPDRELMAEEERLWTELHRLVDSPPEDEMEEPG